jgi:hypothetical protein
MRNAVAFANNDVVTIAWSYGAKPEGCMGFGLYRIDANGEETALPSHAVFPGATIKAGQTTAQFPILRVSACEQDIDRCLAVSEAANDHTSQRGSHEGEDQWKQPASLR